MQTPHTTGREGALNPYLADVEAELAKGTAEAERLLCYGRIGLIVALTLRSCWIQLNIFDVGSLVLVLSYAGLVLVSLRRGTYRPRHASLTAAVDSALVAIGLGSNLFQHHALYQGLVLMPDTVCLAVVIAAAGFRLQVMPAVYGWATAVLGLVLLHVLDKRINTTSPLASTISVTILVIGFSAVGFIAAATAHRSRQALLSHAHVSAQREQVRSQLSGFMHQSHDARSTLSALLFQLDVLERDLADPQRTREAIGTLRTDFQHLFAEVSSMERQAVHGLTPHKRVVQVDMRDAVDLLRSAHPVPGLKVHFSCEEDTAALVAGGYEGLARVLRNLLENARAGHGGCGATRVTIGVSVQEHEVEVLVEDDGPGFEAARLNVARWLPSSKARGHGLGLPFVFAVAQASGGTVTLSNSIDGGAQVRLRFPRGTTDERAQ
jgi:signal transduction histidine kinase